MVNIESISMQEYDLLVYYYLEMRQWPYKNRYYLHTYIQTSWGQYTPFRTLFKVCAAPFCIWLKTLSKYWFTTVYTCLICHDNILSPTIALILNPLFSVAAQINMICFCFGVSSIDTHHICIL